MGRGRLHALAGLALLMAGAPAAQALDWSAVPGKDVTVFHTGQSSWEWLLTKADHGGAEKMREGKTCQDCHAGEEADMGKLIARGEKLEPMPGKAEVGSVVVNVKAVRDGDDLRMRFSWPAADGPGRVALMIDDGGVKEFARGGCFGTCHADLTGMPHAEGTERTKYLVQSRTKIRRTGGGDALKPPAELAALLQAGTFVELWEAELPGGEAEDGWVLEERHERTEPITRATAEQQGDHWVAEIVRPLSASGKGVKTLAPGGGPYPFGIALHQGNRDGRFHLVSLEHTLAIDGGEADLVARKPWPPEGTP